MRFNTGSMARLVARFSRNRRGSVASISAIALIPIVIAAGAALDVSRATIGRGKLQDALDATALALAHLPAGTSQDALQTKGQAWLEANLAGAEIGRPINLTVTPGTGRLVLDADAQVPTVISSLAGISNVPVKAHTEINWGLSHVEIALVLDNTGSMAGTKLTTLKSAANALVDTLADTTDASDPNALKMSLVPFSMTVRLSSSASQLSTYQGSSWMAGALPYTGNYAIDLFYKSSGAADTGVNRFTLFSNIGKSWAGCVESRPAPYDVQDTAPNTSVKNTLFVPYFAPDEPDDSRVKKNYWSYYDFGSANYKGDGVSGSNFTNATSGSTTWKYPQGNKNKYSGYVSGDGPNTGCTGLQALQRLTTSASTVKSKINAMTASGNTNVPMGMMWGWHTLSPHLPFADGTAYGSADTKKIMVVLTDGDNVNSTTNNPNNSSYSGLGYIWQHRLEGADENTNDSERTAAMDARMSLLCTNAKAAGIIIYTVRIDVSGSAPLALMNCATDSSMFYDVPDVADLSKAFNAIAGSIGKLRIAR
jgi:Flp pilus assembly protein TadG